MNPMIKIDKEFQKLIPPLAPEELAQLEENILQDGCRDPLVVWAVPPDDWWSEEDLTLTDEVIEDSEIEDDDRFQYGFETEVIFRSGKLVFVKTRNRQDDEIVEWDKHWIFGVKVLEKNGEDAGRLDPVDGEFILIDGHNRFEICERNAIPYETVQKEFKDRDAASLWIIDNQFGRRNLSILTRVELMEKRKDFVKSRQGTRNDLTSVQNYAEVPPPRDQLAEKAGVSANTYKAAKLCLEHADEETKGKLRRNEVAVHRVAKDIKEKLQRESREEKRVKAAGDIAIPSNLIVGDFSKNSDKVSDGSVSLIFTDPPYDRKASLTLPDLGKFAADKLMDGGSLILYVGQTQIPAALDAIRPHLRYWWTIACLHAGRSTVMREYGINAGWKAMLWFVKGTRHDNSTMVSDVVSGGEEKTHHDWQQSQSEAAYWIEKLTSKGDLICDPYTGGGTTGAATLAAQRKFIGFEIDEKTAKIAAGRIK